MLSVVFNMSFCRMLTCAVMPVLWLQLYHLLSLLLDLLNTELSLETKIPRVGRGRWRLYLLLHFCHYNDSCVKTGSGVRLFNVPFTVVGRVTRQYLQPTNHIFWWGRRVRMEWYWTLSAYQINTLLLGQSASPITYCVVMPTSRYRWVLPLYVLNFVVLWHLFLDKFGSW